MKHIRQDPAGFAAFLLCVACAIVGVTWCVRQHIAQGERDAVIARRIAEISRQADALEARTDAVERKVRAVTRKMEER